MIGGVCNGLAAFFGIDVTIVRIIFVILAVITKGAWAAVYGVMMFVIPHARTSEEHAEAQGLPFNAQEVVNQAKKNFADFKNNKDEWKRHGVTVPIVGLVSAAMFLLFVYALFSLATRGIVFGWPLPPNVPLWAALLGLFVLYHILIAPLRAVR